MSVMPPIQSECSIHFYTEQTGYVLKDKRKVRLWLLNCISTQKVRFGEINFIFCSDNYLLRLNKEHLNHDFFTDVITFPVPTGGIMNADIYISVDRVKDNAKSFGVKLADELHRVMAHGILHLCGYKDKSGSELKEMRKMENKWLRKRG